MPDYTPVERAALAIHHARFGTTTEPLREKGGALDPSGWTLQVATALADGRPLPRRYKDVETRADDHDVRAGQLVLANQSSERPADTPARGAGDAESHGRSNG